MYRQNVYISKLEISVEQITRWLLFSSLFYQIANQKKNETEFRLNIPVQRLFSGHSLAIHPIAAKW